MKAGSVHRESTSKQKLGRPGNDCGVREKERAVTEKWMEDCRGPSVPYSLTQTPKKTEGKRGQRHLIQFPFQIPGNGGDLRDSPTEPNGRVRVG